MISNLLFTISWIVLIVCALLHHTADTLMMSNNLKILLSFVNIFPTPVSILSFSESRS